MILNEDFSETFKKFEKYKGYCAGYEEYDFLGIKYGQP